MLEGNTIIGNSLQSSDWIVMCEWNAVGMVGLERKGVRDTQTK